MICLDFDGVVANYANHTTETRFNNALLDILPPPPQRVAIVTNQGGMALHASEPDKYPSPERVALRLTEGVRWLKINGYTVDLILVSAYHPDAARTAIARAAEKLRTQMQMLPMTLRQVAPRTIVYTTKPSRKPSPFMLRVAPADVYYGDSPEDEQAAQAAGALFVRVPRFN